MNARKTLSLVGLTALFAMGAPAFAANDDGGPPSTRPSQTEAAAAILPDQSEIANTDSAVNRSRGPLAQALWISWLFRATAF